MRCINGEYRAPRWLPDGHAQTLYPALWMPKPRIAYRRERWTTPDGDFIEADWATDEPAASSLPMSNGLAQPAPPLAQADAAPAARPLLVLFHGLEGSSASHYASVLMAAAVARGWDAVVPHFRSCSGPLNLAPRFYHSGDSAEIHWMLARLRLHRGGPIYVAGVSLGGNALLRWLGEYAGDAGFVTAAAAISAPLDLQAGGHALATGFNRIYTRHFLNTLKRKSLAKLVQFPGLFDRDAMLASADLYAFDNVVTAPLHGYRDTDDYWHRAAAKPILPDIRVPTLVLNARNDPFLPAHALPCAAQAGPMVELDQPAQGGHVGFASGPFPGGGAWLVQRLFRFFDEAGRS